MAKLPPAPLDRRRFLGVSLGALLASTMDRNGLARAASASLYDLVIVGAGAAGMPAAIFAARRGASVLLLDAADQVGGTLWLALGQVCAAGTRIQARHGIMDDHPDLHFEDVMRLSGGLADPVLVRRTADLAPAMIDWLDERGWACRDDHVLTGESPGRPGYSRRRYYQAPGEGRSILAVLARELAREIGAGRVTLQLGARVEELLGTDSGRVEGVRARAGGGLLAFRGRHVLLTSGGYASNPLLFEELIGQPSYVDSSYAFSQGDGLQLARSAGAALRNRELHRPGLGSVLSEARWPASIHARFETHPQLRMPWEIWVNDRGQRFVNEEAPLAVDRERALNAQPRLRYAIIFDQAMLAAAPPGIAEWTREELERQFNTHPMFHRAGTLPELAARAGVDPEGLAASVAGYNARLAGTDPWGRSHRPLPVTRPPFHAIIQYGHSATSAVGIAVDASLRAVTSNGEPVAGLYAAGEALGSGVYLGDGFVPGMMITPSMTLGRWLGETLA